jgi:putative PEP-CTERM system histidine kinase
MNAVVTISVFIGILTYAAFLVFCVANWLRGITGFALLTAAVVTFAWLLSPLFTFSRDFYLTLEPIVLVSWSLLLVRALGLNFSLRQPQGFGAVFWTFATLALLGGSATLACLAAALGWVGSGIVLLINLCLLVVNILGLVLVEQLAQNSVSDFRWRIRYMNIGLGLMFTFGMVHHALAILFEGPLLILSAVQPAVMALITPFIVVASLRNRTNKLKFSLSRDFVFRTGVLVATGVFLLLLGLFGYLAQIFAGDIGLTLAVFGSLVAIAFFLVVVGSSRFRSQMRVQLAKTFFEYRYDYRAEWMKVTAQLTEPNADFDLAQQAQRLILGILNANSACLWTMHQQSLVPASQIEALQWSQPLPAELTQSLIEFYSSYDWILDLQDMPVVAQEIASNITLIPDSERAGYLVPLFVENRLFGVCLVGQAEVPTRLSWEDYDIIKLISKQCAAFLALQEANQQLVESEQISAVSQMTAFLLHDIKTIAAQLSLMLDNAPKHRDNPQFIDDMLATTKNSVTRMEHIIAGLRQSSNPGSADVRSIDLTKFLADRCHDATGQRKQTDYDIGSQPAVVNIDEDALESALTHLEQNAYEATANNQGVRISLLKDTHWAQIQVKDAGQGMSEEFVKSELFTPFRSTKGLTGMGIGAYQARARIRGLGGDLQVESKLGVGTTFTIKLPLVSEESS